MLSMTDSPPPDPPSPFVERWMRSHVDAIPAPRRALDLAMGRGRHALLLAELGCRTFGVDIQWAFVAATVREAQRRGYSLRAWCADLTRSRLPRGRFELIVVTRYLQRDLFPELAAALSPGGFLIYETFTEAQRARRWGPTSPDHLLKPGELRAAAGDLEVMFYEEVAEPEAVARLVARSASSRS